MGRPDIALSPAELILIALLVVLGLGCWSGSARLVGAWIVGGAPRVEDSEQPFKVSFLQMQLSLQQRAWRTTQDAEVQAQLDLARSTDSVNAFESLYGTSGAPYPVQPLSTATPHDWPSAYGNALLQKEADIRLVVALSAQVTALQQQTQEADDRLAVAERHAREHYNSARSTYLLLRSAFTLGLAVAITGVLLLVCWAIWKRRPAKETVEMPVILFSAGAIVAMLFAYNAFELAGVALVSVILLLILLTRHASTAPVQHSSGT
jgi:hypothetical protein